VPASGLSRTLLVAISLFLFPFARATHAQRNELAFLAGLAGPQSQTITAGGNTITSGSVSPGAQINYAARMMHRVIDGYVELPFVFVLRASGQTITGLGATISGSAGPDIYFTPGSRFQFLPRSRLSPYAAAGFGIASFAATPSIAPGGMSVPGNRENSAALGFGAGLDLRLTPFLSLRGDARDFYTGRNLGAVKGWNHGLFQGLPLLIPEVRTLPSAPLPLPRGMHRRFGYTESFQP
jgi:hypothetical protein